MLILLYIHSLIMDGWLFHWLVSAEESFLGGCMIGCSVVWLICFFGRFIEGLDT